MHPSAQALRALQSDSTLTIRVRRLGFLIALAVGMTCGVAQGQSLITTLGGTLNPAAMAVNQTTNTIYLADGSFSQMTVINGEANTSAQIVPGGGPYNGLAVNPTTNTIYALNNANPAGVVVIDGSDNTATTTVALTAAAKVIAVNPVTNQIYVAGTDNVWVIDGSTNAITATIAISQAGHALAVDT